MMQLGPEKGVGIAMAKAEPSNTTIAPASIVKLNLEDSADLLIFEVFKYQRHPVTIDSCTTRYITCEEGKN